MKIFPSLASAEPMNLGDSIRRLEGYPYLHLDIEDGNFVPNITFGMKLRQVFVLLRWTHI